MNKKQINSIDRIELMQTFLRIVDAGSLSAAALLLGTTQPTISRRLKTLEQLLGLKLIQRTTHQMKLTEEGERCYQHASALLASWQMIEDDLLGASETPRGTLRVLVPHAFGQDQMIVHLQRFLARYPHITVEWMLSDRTPDFLAEDIDCAIHVGALTDPTVVARLVAEVPRIVIGAPALLQNRPFPEHPQQLQTLPWIALSTFYRHNVTLTHGSTNAEYPFDIQPQLLTDSLYALRNAVLNGIGIGITSEWIVEEDIAQGTLIHLTPEWHAPPLPVYLVYPYARYYPVKLTLFLAMMREAMPVLSGTQYPRQGVARQT